MIEIRSKEDCVGCSACVVRCPVQCISFERDEQGFRYPKVDASRCIGCSLCEKVCPVVNQAEAKEPFEVYGAINEDSEIVRTSSSGGIFYALASKIIERGGVVFGARFDHEFNVVHSYTETLEGLRAFQGSKYVQSDMGDCFRQAEDFLKRGKIVMFTGTSCQIAALVLFLRKDYGNQLIKVDVICHGVPSPLVWSDYLHQNIKRTDLIKRISFRDKRNGWEQFGFSCVVDKNFSESDSFEPIRRNVFTHSFLMNLTLRPSCFYCPSKCGRSMSDLTLGDYWRVDILDPMIASDFGTSLVLIYSKRGQSLFEQLSLKKLVSTYGKALVSNPVIVRPTYKPKLYDRFWQEYIASRTIGTVKLYIRRSQRSLLRRGVHYMKRKFNSFFGNKKK